MQEPITQKCLFDYILPNIISIGSSLGKELKIPDGSGTFIKFTIEINQKPIDLYGILTASHVLEKIDLITHYPTYTQCIGLMKPIDRSGDSYAETYPVNFLYTAIDSKHMRAIVANPQINSIDRNERDIAFICLHIGKVNDQSKLISNSDFFDLKSNPMVDLPKIHDQTFIFFKGACSDDLVQDKILSTKLIIEHGGKIKKYPKSNIIYHEIPNSDCIPLNGASGAGLWMFTKDKQDNIIKILKGVIVEGDTKHTNAIDISYVTNDFIPALEKIINKDSLQILGPTLWSNFYTENPQRHYSI